MYFTAKLPCSIAICGQILDRIAVDPSNPAAAYFEMGEILVMEKALDRPEKL